MCQPVVQFIKDENGEIHGNSNSSGGLVENLFQLQNTHATGEIRAWNAYYQTSQSWIQRYWRWNYHSFGWNINAIHSKQIILQENIKYDLELNTEKIWNIDDIKSKLAKELYKREVQCEIWMLQKMEWIKLH